MKLSQSRKYMLQAMFCGLIAIALFYGCSEFPATGVDAVSNSRVTDSDPHPPPSLYYWVEDDLMGEGLTQTYGNGIPWCGDLGVNFLWNDVLMIVTGDVIGWPGIFDPLALQAYGCTPDLDPSDGINNVVWAQIEGGNPVGITAPAIPQHTIAPTGAVTTNGAAYIYFMHYYWGQPRLQYMELYKSTDPLSYASYTSVETHTYPQGTELEDYKFINVSPISGTYNAQEVIYLFATGDYRNSPVYLAYVSPNDIEDFSSYVFFAGMYMGNPTWSSDEDDAVPIIENVEAGELSVVYSEFLDAWLLGFFRNIDGDGRSFNLYTAHEPWGEWYISNQIYKDNTRISPLNEDWNTNYGGYFLDLPMVDSYIYWINSMWEPYATTHEECIVLMRTDLSELTFTPLP